MAEIVPICESLPRPVPEDEQKQNRQDCIAELEDILKRFKSDRADGMIFIVSDSNRGIVRTGWKGSAGFDRFMSLGALKWISHRFLREEFCNEGLNLEEE